MTDGLPNSEGNVPNEAEKKIAAEQTKQAEQEKQELARERDLETSQDTLGGGNSTTSTTIGQTPAEQAAGIPPLELLETPATPPTGDNVNGQAAIGTVVEKQTPEAQPAFTNIAASNQAKGIVPVKPAPIGFNRAANGVVTPGSFSVENAGNDTSGTQGPPDDNVRAADKSDEQPERSIEGGDAIASATQSMDVKDETNDHALSESSVRNFADQILKDLAATVQGMKLSQEEAERARRSATVIAYCTIASIGAPDDERAHLGERIKGANTTLLNQLVGNNVDIRKAARDQLYRTVRAVVGKVLELLTAATVAV